MPDVDVALGPLGLRDEHVFSQPRLTLPSVGADVLTRGQTTWRASLMLSNSFAWSQDAPGERPMQRRYLLDAEATTLDVQATRGLGAGWDVSLRLALRARGGGVLDSVIDAFHRGFAFTGLDDGQRPAFRRDAFRVEGRGAGGRRFAWREGVGLGQVELALRRQIGGGPDARQGTRTALAWVARVSLPTGRGPFSGHGSAVALQVVGRRRVHSRLHLHVGLGAVGGGARRVDGVSYSRWQPAAFVAAEWRLGARTRLLLESDVAGRLVREVDGLPGGHWVAQLGVARRVAPRATLTLALTENLKPQAVTPDLALYAGLTLRR